jgi:3D (Asp-Asp-Asp) domain-containing protein
MKRFIIIFIFSLVALNGYSKDEFVTHVTLTTYNAVKAQCDNDPLVTADGTRIDLKKLKKGEIKYAAVSRDLLWHIPLGSIIYIDGHGYYEVRDTMNKRFNHYIDILQHTSQRNFKKENVRIVLVKKPKKKNKLK